MPLFEIICILLVFLGICFSLIIFILPNSFRNYANVLLIYIFLGNNASLLLKYIESSSNIYKNKISNFIKYKFFLLINMNHLIFMLIPFISFSLILSITLNDLYDFINIMIITFAFLNILHFTHKNFLQKIYMITSILIILSTFIRETFFIKVLLLILISLIFSHLTLLSTFVEYKNPMKYNLHTNIYILFFINNILNRKLENLFYTIIFISYTYIIIKYNSNVSIFSLASIFTIFNGIVHTQIIMGKKNANLSRSLFLSNSKNKIKRVIFGNFFYKNIYIFFLPIIIFPILLIFNRLNIVQLILNYMWMIILLFYFSYLDKKISINKKKRPTFWEEYLLLAITIIIMLIK